MQRDGLFEALKIATATAAEYAELNQRLRSDNQKLIATVERLTEQLLGKEAG